MAERAPLRSNLDAILDRAESKDPAPALVVVGMEAPPNLGLRYTSAFRDVFRTPSSNTILVKLAYWFNM